MTRSGSASGVGLLTILSHLVSHKSLSLTDRQGKYFTRAKTWMRTADSCLLSGWLSSSSLHARRFNFQVHAAQMPTVDAASMQDLRWEQRKLLQLPWQKLLVKQRLLLPWRQLPQQRLQRNLLHAMCLRLRQAVLASQVVDYSQLEQKCLLN